MNRLSIAMCTYNGARFLPQQLDSIAIQTRVPDELVICDDGSSDHTISIIENYAKKVGFTVKFYLNDKRLGVTKNYEKTISLCEGDIIVLSDQDDVWSSQKLKRLEEVFNRKPNVGVVFSNADIVDEDLHSLGYNLWDSIGLNHRVLKTIVSTAACRLLIVQGALVTGATMAFRASYKDIILPIPDCWVHDAWISHLLAAVSYFDYINEPLILYRQHANNQIGAARVGFYQKLQRTKKRRQNKMLDNLLQRYDSLKERLIKSPYDIHDHNKLLVVLQIKRDHVAARASLPRYRLLRLPVIFRETITLKYFRYSNGIHSIAQDLLLR